MRCPSCRSRRILAKGSHRPRDMPRQRPAAFLAGLILPHQEMTDGPMGKFWPTSSPFAITPEPLVGAHLYHRPMPGTTTAAGAWFTLRRRITIYPPEPAGRPGICAVCRGPARAGYARCYQCGQHDLLGPDLLADAVVPISYAVKGTVFAASLWRYKSWRSPDPAARTQLLTLLLHFLRPPGRGVWRQAGMPAPGRRAVVPTGCARPGPHPLLAMAGP